jgi:hypothetical protein
MHVELNINRNDSEKWEGEYPDTISFSCRPDIILTAIGIGEFPYYCEYSDKHPKAMIYQGSGSWYPLDNGTGKGWE